jgi:hypothetical protein
MVLPLRSEHQGTAASIHRLVHSRYWASSAALRHVRCSSPGVGALLERCISEFSILAGA